MANTSPDLTALRAAYEAEKAKGPANRAATITAWAALVAASPRQKTGGYGSRAGQRQWRERNPGWPLPGRKR